MLDMAEAYLQACAAGSWVAAVRQAHPPAELDHVLLLEHILHQTVVLNVSCTKKEAKKEIAFLN